MARVVIDIPDKDRRDIYWSNGKRVANLIGEYKVLAVLPEGHGRLVDVKDLDLTSLYMVEGKVCCTAPTVIEADKEKADEKEE